MAYAHAENAERHLKSKPLSARTRDDYERALQGYRSVYHGDPASPDAGRSIAAVADLLAEEGRCFHDEKLLHDAVAQWEFLRREYPGSPLRQRALFQQAQITQHDLHNPAAAKKIYRSFLTHYPNDSLAEKARAALESVREDVRNGQSPSPSLRREGSNTVARSRPAPHPSVSEQGASKKRQQDFTLAAATDTLPGAAKRVNINHPVSSPPSFAAAGIPSAQVATIQAVRYWAEGNSTRFAVDMNQTVPYHAYLARNGKQITLVFFGAHLSESLMSRPIPVEHDANFRSIRASILTGDQAELVLELNHPADFSSFALANPNRLILDVRAAQPHRPSAIVTRTDAPQKDFAPPKTPAKIPARQYAATRRTQPILLQPSAPQIAPIPAADDIASTTFSNPASLAEPASSAEPTADGQRSMARVLGLRIRRIVIDAGHGGHDSGTLGPDGLEEKDVALDVALRLGHLLHQRLGADVIYTRRTDKFVPLEERTAIANRNHADLFLSIHANSSSDPETRGVETYFLNFTASPDALQVAARENAISNRSVHELSDLVRKIALSDKIDESREFAADVQQSLYSGLSFGNAGMRNRGVKQAPFAVLIGANMPSILAEISFLTNPDDANELTEPIYRERIAEALYSGVAQYVDGMSGVRVAKTAQPEALQASAE